MNSYIDQAQAGFLQQSGDPVAAKQMAWQTLANLRREQASALAYFVSALVAFALIFVVLTMKRSVAEKGAHVAAE